MSQNSGSCLEVIEYFKERFGIGEEFLREFEFYFKGDIYWIIQKEVLNSSSLDVYKVYSLGFPFARKLDKGIKPTSWALIWLKDKIKKNKIELDIDKVRELLLSNFIEIDAPLERGYVAISLNGDVIGCGFYKEGILRAEIPKSRRKTLLEIL